MHTTTAPYLSRPLGCKSLGQPAPSRDLTAAAEDLFERRDESQGKAPVNLTVGSELAQVLADFETSPMWHGWPWATRGLDRRLLKIAKILVEKRAVDWDVTLAPLITPVARREGYWQRLVRHLADCDPQLYAQHQTAMRLVAIEHWTCALLRVATAKGCNVQLKIGGLEATARCLCWALQEILAADRSLMTLRLRYLWWQTDRRICQLTQRLERLQRCDDSFGSGESLCAAPKTADQLSK